MSTLSILTKPILAMPIGAVDLLKSSYDPNNYWKLKRSTLAYTYPYFIIAQERMEKNTKRRKYFC